MKHQALGKDNKMKNMHGYEIVVNADRSDWGKKWGVAPEDDKRCWCYSCTMRRLKEKREKKILHIKERKNMKMKKFDNFMFWQFFIGAFILAMTNPPIQYIGATSFVIMLIYTIRKSGPKDTQG